MEAVLVSPGIYAVGGNAYLQTQPYNQRFELSLPDAPFVTKAYWAKNSAAIERCINRNVSVDLGSDGELPPLELLLGTTGTYAELQSNISMASQKAAERAEYSKDGVFVHKKISIGRYEFCFLLPEIIAEERAYAIEISLQV